LAKSKKKLARPTPKLAFLEWREFNGDLHPFLLNDRVRSGETLLWDSRGDEGVTKLVKGKISIDPSGRPSRTSRPKERITFVFGVGDGEVAEVRLWDRFAWPESIEHPLPNVPDLALHVFLVGHGYQIDFYEDGEEVASGCRDFGGTHRISKLKRGLATLLKEAIEKWRSKL
jgi:hypothetical protein